MNYTRKNKTITKFDKDGDGNMKKIDSHTFDSINLAKKESHRIQISTDGALGRGCLKRLG